MAERTDKELIVAIQKGDIESFENLVTRYQNKLLIFIYGVTHDKSLAEEIVQDTFFNIYKTISRVDVERKFSSYIYKVAKNIAISYLRKQKNDLSLNETFGLAAVSDDLYEDAVKKENQEKVWKALNLLEEKYREVIKLYYFKDLSYKEVARALSLPLNTVKIRLKRAKDALRRIINYEKQ
jgi:RNA polymerase sigma-70 factor (ECF subfamily)